MASDLKNLGPDHPGVARSRSNLALVYADLGDHARARDLLEAALASDFENFGPDHVNVAVRYNMIFCLGLVIDTAPKNVASLRGYSWDPEAPGQAVSKMGEGGSC